MHFKNIMIFILIFALNQMAEASPYNICSKIYYNSAYGPNSNPLVYFPELESDYPLIANIVTGRIANKTRSSFDKDTWLELIESIDSCTGKLCILDLNNKDFVFRGYLEIRKSKLIFVVDFFQLKTTNASGDRVKVDLKKRANNLNFKFVTLVNLIFSSVHRYLESHPEILTVRIAGSRVVNLNLALALEKAGFTSKQPKATTIAKTIIHSGNIFTSSSLALLAQLSNSKPLHFFMYSIATGPLAVSTLITKKADEEMARDWILELPVNRESENNSQTRSN